LSSGVGFLPVLGLDHGLGPVATGALVSLLAATAALVQPYAGRRVDDRRFTLGTGSVALTGCAGGFVIAALLPGVAGIALGALFIGAGVAVATPLGFSLLARSSPPDRMGRTMGAAEVGRELGDAGGPILVGAFGLVSLTAGLGALALALFGCAGMLARPAPRGDRDITLSETGAEEAGPA
jgi:MFS family permease